MKPCSLDLGKRVVARVAPEDPVRSGAAAFVVVVLDTTRSFEGQGKAVRDRIRAAGTHLPFRPPDSPDLHPIGRVFAKLKHLVRPASERTTGAV